MATISSPSVDSTSNLPANKTTSVNHLNRSIERALDEATYTGELNLSSRTLREFPDSKCDLSDTIIAGQ